MIFEPTLPPTPADCYAGCWEADGRNTHYTIESDQDGGWGVVATNGSVTHERSTMTLDYAIAVCRTAERDGGFSHDWEHWLDRAAPSRRTAADDADPYDEHVTQLLLMTTGDAIERLDGCSWRWRGKVVTHWDLLRHVADVLEHG
jgi:hypothetical protein